MARAAHPTAMVAPRFVGGGAVEWREVPVPEPGPGQLLLAVRANALCGSDRRRYLEGSTVTPGHEAAGVVVAAGPETGTPVGTPGVVYLMVYCGACRGCRAGATNQCLDRRGDLGFNLDGGLAPYELVPESVFFPVDPDFPLSDATMLLDVMGTSRHAIERAMLLQPDVQSVLVGGAGPVGLGLLAMARLLLGDGVPVLITDVDAGRLELAAGLGGTPVKVPDEAPADAIRRLGLPGADLAFDASGRGAARRASLDALGSRGVLVCVGHGEDLALDVSADLIRPERAVLGSEYFPFGMLADNLPLLREHQAYLGQVITHRFPVDALEQACEAFFGNRAGAAVGKVVVEQ